MKHLKIQHLSNNSKNTAVPKKVQIFEIQNPKKYSADPSVNVPSPPPGVTTANYLTKSYNHTSIKQ